MSLERFFAFVIESTRAVVLTLTVAVQVRPYGEVVSWSAMIAAYFGYYLLCETLAGQHVWQVEHGPVQPLGEWPEMHLRTGAHPQPAPAGGSQPALFGRFCRPRAALFATNRRQRIGDLLAGTVVLRRASLPTPGSRWMNGGWEVLTPGVIISPPCSTVR